MINNDKNEDKASNSATPRLLCDTAKEIKKTWPNINYAARPYLGAMESITTIDSYYYADSAKSVVLYFLANAGTWRGPDARRIKAELKKIAGVK